jgi:hypothetical protein
MTQEVKNLSSKQEALTSDLKLQYHKEKRKKL